MKSIFKTLVFIIAITGMISLAATVPQQNQQQEWKAKNLKVLPADISHKALDSIMDGFKAALGVKCNFCHAQSKTDAKKLDFASDEKREKLTARNMMLMTDSINHQYFSRHLQRHGTYAVTCATCHRGDEHPLVNMPAVDKMMPGNQMPEKKER